MVSLWPFQVWIIDINKIMSVPNPGAVVYDHAHVTECLHHTLREAVSSKQDQRSECVLIEVVALLNLGDLHRLLHVVDAEVYHTELDKD